MDNNKEYIINIRVSKETYRKLKAKAKEESESLSSLVRKTLNDSYEIFKDIKQDIFGNEEKSSGNMLHYQKIILAKDTACERCHNEIAKGSQAYLGESKTGTKKYFCAKCFDALQ
ncbi:MAG: hypothetical protein WCV50_04650 [Patescibacteria group bacterium]|jgi:predicted CopG family antitoxin